MTRRTLITLRLDPDLLAHIDADTDTDTTRSVVIRRILRRHYTERPGQPTEQENQT